MDAYIYPIATAVTVFPVLAAIITLPYAINQYHKYGALLVLRIILIYSFVFYLMTSYFMTILPLPPIDSVQEGGTHMLLVPFSALRLWWNNCGLALNNPTTYLPSVMNYDFLQIAFNILLLVPFGVYLRYYFEKKWHQVLLLSFAYSLFFELTQLSGLYGIYPHAYRWFEVDDLICNTLGGMLGFFITPLCSFFLPTRERLNELSYRKGERVSMIRKGLANAIDWIVILILMIVGSKYIGQGILFRIFSIDIRLGMTFILPISFFLYFVLSTWLLSGRTIGKYVLSLQLKGKDDANENRKARLHEYVIRYGIIYLLILPTPEYIFTIESNFLVAQNTGYKILLGICMAILIVNFLSFIIDIFASAVMHHSQNAYEKISNTVYVSTVKKNPETNTVEAESITDTADTANTANTAEPIEIK